MKKQRTGTNVYEGEKNQECLSKYQLFATRKREVNFRNQFYPELFDITDHGYYKELVKDDV
jgi:hypothetical protein